MVVQASRGTELGTGNIPDGVKPVLLALAYFVIGTLSFHVDVSHGIVTPVVFGAEGIALASALVYGPGLWPGVLLGQLALALSHRMPIVLALGVSLVYSAEYLLASALTRRLRIKPELTNLRDLLLLLILIFGVLQPFSATLGVGVLTVCGHTPRSGFGSNWFAWWLGNCMGQLVVTPAVAGLLSSPTRRIRAIGRQTAILLAVLLPIGWALFGIIDGRGMALAYAAVVPVLVFVAARTSPTTASIGNIAIMAVLLTQTQHGLGPFAQAGNLQLVDLNLYLLGCSSCSLFVAVLFRERDEYHWELKKANKSLSLEADVRVKLIQELESALSDSKSMQVIVDQKNERLNQLNSQKNFLLGMAAHDLRNPLSIILGYSKFLRKRKIDPVQAQDFLGCIETSANFMLGLLDELLDVSTLESGQLSIHPELVDLRKLAEKVVHMNRPLAEVKQIAVNYQATQDPLPVWVDPPKIDQVLTNLITNAIKFSPRESDIEVSVEQLGDNAKFTVVDRGVGIPEQEQGNLFTPFGRTSVRGTAGEKSTGLGLAIARRIIEGHQGTIGMTSKVGQGSNFWISLPLSALEVGGAL